MWRGEERVERWQVGVVWFKQSWVGSKISNSVESDLFLFFAFFLLLVVRCIYFLSSLHRANHGTVYVRSIIFFPPFWYDSSR